MNNELQQKNQIVILKPFKPHYYQSERKLVIRKNQIHYANTLKKEPLLDFNNQNSTIKERNDGSKSKDKLQMNRSHLKMKSQGLGFELQIHNMKYKPFEVKKSQKMCVIPVEFNFALDKRLGSKKRLFEEEKCPVTSSREQLPLQKKEGLPLAKNGQRNKESNFERLSKCTKPVDFHFLCEERIKKRNQRKIDSTSLNESYLVDLSKTTKGNKTGLFKNIKGGVLLKAKLKRRSSI
jgi:hypothetical protein